MRRSGICLLILGGILLLITPAMAQQTLVETVVNGCKDELEKYCADVTPGEGPECSLVCTLMKISFPAAANMPSMTLRSNLSGPWPQFPMP